MLIDRIQEQKATEDAISYLTKHGVIPSIYEISNYTKDYFLNHKKGQPLTEPLNIKPHSVSNKTEWNKHFENIDKDLDTISVAINTVLNEAILKDELTESQKNDILCKIKKINLRAAALKEALTDNIPFLSYSIIFNNFNGAEFYPNKNINLPKTTAFIDLLHKKVMIPKVTLNKDVINLQNSILNIYSNNKDCNVYGDINEFIKNDKMLKIQNTSINNTADSLVLEIVLDNTYELSSVAIELDTIKEISGSLTISYEDGAEETLYSETFANNMEWLFEQNPVKSFKISLTKNEADGFIDGIYYYTYILKKITASNDKFKSSATYISKKINFDQIIDEVKLKTEDMIFSDTNINYFVGIDNDNEVIDWISVDKNKYTNLEILLTQQEILNKNTRGYGTKIGKLYKIGTIKPNYNKPSLNLYSGYQQWNVEAIKNDKKFDDNYVIDINDYNKSNLLAQSVLDCESYNINIKTKTLFALTTYVYCDDLYVVKDNDIIPADKTTNLQTKIYVNNNLVKPTGTNKYNITLQKGKNKIILLLYSTTTEKNKNGTILQMNIDFKKASQNITCNKKMQYVSYNTLLYGMRENTAYYTIDENNNILVNSDPYKNMDCCLLTEYGYSKDELNFQDYMRYMISYKYLNPDKNTLCLKNNNEINKRKFSFTIDIDDINNIPKTHTVNQDGYSGEIPKIGEPELISGTYIPDRKRDFSKTRTSSKSDDFPDTIDINEDGYTGKINKSGKVRIESGEYIPSDTKTVSKQQQFNTLAEITDTINYYENNYSGVLSKVGSPIKVDNDSLNTTSDIDYTDTTEYNSEDEVPSHYSYHKDGTTYSLSLIGTEKVFKGYEQKSTYDYKLVDHFHNTVICYVHKVDGQNVAYVDSCIYPPDDPIWHKYSDIINNANEIDGMPEFMTPGDENHTEVPIHDDVKGDGMKYDSDYNLFQLYKTGTIDDKDKPIYVYKGKYHTSVTNQGHSYLQTYTGNVTKPSKDTRLYAQDYFGTLIIKGSDTRKWQQTYEGILYKTIYNITVPSINLRIMAILNTNNKSLSPQIKSLSLMGR